MFWMALALAADGVVDRVAAVVDNDIVLLSDVYDLGGNFVEEQCASPIGKDACIYESELEILDALIKRSLIKRELERLQFGVSSADVDEAIEGIMRDYGMPDRKTLRAEIEKAGLTWKTYRGQLRDQMQVQRFQQRVLAPRVNVTDDEVKDLYDRTVRGEAVPAVKVSAFGLVLPPTEQAQAAVLVQAGDLVAKIRAGETPFEEAQAEFDAAGIGKALGDRTYQKGQLTPQLDAVLFDVEPGVVLDPVRVGTVLMIVRVDERSEVAVEVKSFAEASDALRQQLMVDGVTEAEEVWYQRMRREVSVKVMLPEPS